MWIGTQDGLNFFDGYSFKIFNKNSANFIGGNDIKSIVYDKQNNLLWVAFSYGGISAIDCQTHKTLINLNEKNSALHSKSSSLNALWLTSENELLIVAETTCYTYNRRSGQLTILLNTENSFQGSRRITAVFDDERNYYLLIQDEGVVCISKRNKKIFKIITGFINEPENNFHKFSKIIVRKEDTTYFATEQGIGIFLPDLRCLLKWKTSGVVDAFALDKENTVWYCKESKLKNQSNGNLKNIFFEPKTDLPETQFYLTLFFDNKENLWAGGSEGLIFSNLSFPVFKKYNGDSDKKIKLSHLYDILPADSLAYLNDLKGLFVINIKTSQTEHIDTSGYPFYILKMPNGDILFNNERGFYLVIDKKINGKLFLKRYPELSKISRRLISCHLILNDSTIVLGSEDFKGIIIWDFKHHLVDEISPDLKTGWQDNAINSMCKKDDGSIIICQDKYIAVFDPSTRLVKNHSLVIDKDTARLYFDILNTKSHYIIGTYGYGIIVTDKEFTVKKQINSSSGLSNNNVYRILMDSQGFLWVSTNFGLNRIDLTNSSVSRYFEKDGLSSDAFEEMSSARQNNVLFFGGLNGFTIVQPENIIKNISKPEVYFTSYNLKTSRLDSVFTNIELTKIKIPNYILQSTFYFAAPNYITTGKTNYFYKIVELQNKWIKVEDQNNINIMGLSPRTYHLQIQAFNADGVPSDIKELTLIFLPKWYQTWWFKTLLALAFVAIVYSIYRMRINQLKKEQRIRTKLAGDLHDDLGSTMNSVKVYASLAIMEKQADKYLPLIKEGSQEAINGIRDIIWVLDDKRNSLEQLLSRISLFAAPLCEANHLGYQQELADDARDHKLGQEEKRNLYMMIKEAINNAIKYSGAQTISIGVSVKKGKTLIHIRDDGKGFDTSITNEGNGLKNMQRRAKEIKYDFRIESSAGSGTTIHFEKI